MIQLGKTQCLNIIKKTDFGVYLGTEDDKVLLPKKQVPEDIEIGDALGRTSKVKFADDISSVFKRQAYSYN